MSATLPSQGPAVVGLPLNLSLCSTAWAMQAPQQLIRMGMCGASRVWACVEPAGFPGSVPSSVGSWSDHLRTRLPPHRPADAHFLPLKSLWEQSLPTEGRGGTNKRLFVQT